MSHECLGCDSEVDFYYGLCDKCFEKMPMGAWASFFERSSMNELEEIKSK